MLRRHRYIVVPLLVSIWNCWLLSSCPRSKLTLSHSLSCYNIAIRFPARRAGEFSLSEELEDYAGR